MPNIEVQALTTKTAAFQGAAVDISALSEFRLKLHIHSITDGKSVQFALETTVGADFTGTVVKRWVKTFRGALPPEGHVFQIHSRMFDRIPLGTANGKMRLVIDDIDAGDTTSVKYSARLEGAV